MAMVFERLVPQPKRVRGREGEFVIPPLVFVEHSKAVQGASRAVAVVQESLAAAGVNAEVRRGMSPAPGFWIRIGAGTDGTPGIRWATDSVPSHNEGYRMEVLPGEIRLASATAHGLYYAACTLEQLIKAAAARALPAVEIEDWPDIGLRMVLYDLARDRDYHPEYVKRLIDEMSRFKINAVMLYLEYRYAFPSHPDIGPAGSMTPAQARDLDRFARERFVEVVPQVNCLGHMEGMNNLERYHGLAENPAGGGFQTCPSNTDVIPLLRDLYRDVSAQFSTQLLHAGGDESWELGVCPRCARRAGRLGKGGIYLDHVKGVRRIAQRLRKRLALWGDMLLAHRRALDGLPRDVLVFDWIYEGTRSKSMRLFQRKGFDIVVCPASISFEATKLYSSVMAHSRVVDNIRRLIADGHRAGAAGECTCLWEMQKGVFPEYSWHHIALSAQCAWNRRSMGGRAFTRAFTRQFFGYDGDEIERYLRIVGEEMPEPKDLVDTKHGRWLRDILFGAEDPLRLWAELRQRWSPRVARKIRAKSRAARQVLAAIERKATRHREVLPYLGFPLRLYRFLVEYAQGVSEARKAYAAAAASQRRDSERFTRALERCADRLSGLDSIFEELEEFLRRAHRETGAPRLDVERMALMREMLDAKVRQIRALPFEGPTLMRFEVVARQDWRLYNQANWRQE